MALAFPDIGPRSIMFHPQNVSRSGGIATNGLEQIVSSGAGRFRAALTATIATDDHILAWRAFVFAMQGRSGTTLVPAYDGKRVPWPVDAYERALTPRFVREEALDGTIYEQAEIPSASEVMAVADSAAALHANEIDVLITQGQPLRAGNYFSVGESLYVVTAISDQVAGVQTATIWPPLRDGVSDGTGIQITRPVCRMRFASDDEGELTLEMMQYGSITCAFVEDIPGPGDESPS